MEGGDVRGGRRRWKGGGGECWHRSDNVQIYVHFPHGHSIYIYLLAQHTYIIYGTVNISVEKMLKAKWALGKSCQIVL